MSKNKETLTDPMERIIADALDAANIRYKTGHGGHAPLDFYLIDFDVHIEVKQFHSNRIAEQMSRAPNVIAIQGRAAAEWFARRIT